MSLVLRCAQYAFITLASLMSSICLAQNNVSQSDESLKKILSEINANLAQKDYQSAYQKAEAEIDEWAGEPNFDFLYAQAALEQAKYDEAIFALERVLVSWPDHVPSHYLLGLTYAKQKNYTQASGVFSSLLNAQLSPSMRDRVSQALEAVERNTQKLEQSFNHTVSLALGHDSNVNSGALDDRIVIGGLPLTLGQSSLKTADNFMRFKYRFRGNWQQTQYQGWKLDVNYSDQRHKDADQYDRYQGSIRFGYEHKKDDFTFSTGGQFGVLTLDNNTYQQDFGLYGSVQYNITPHYFTALSGFAFSQNNVQDRNLDSRIYTIQGSAGYSSALWLLKADIGYTWQPARYDEGEHYGRDYNFISGSVSHKTGEKGLLSFKAQYRDIEHRADHPLFLSTRNEELVILNLNWRYKWSQSLSVDLSASYYDKHSSITLYSYDRTEWFSGVRYEF
ncbi:tetratricopeptide repeat protein [Pseudoalteromonas luteoviolacea]|uniref:Uncharacterized protein n=1 Tax=Pseudoalteromonas luteoviolacea S4054 TaxID=1129367 RepID=A0A0F6AB88_9GAMM|nr:tetratricopeptide repeat protein [Pseudoalteromonas luteoviolacea]AOT08598.1 hypothetical protein S4054249_12375 [Pseudoalteromonas luteoviolacea]AOT13514.1 hypothetical protein S40542_12350 [Pseudoalteromonas luteoviolacea]AOT18427.1 hypothetical protein S4054_12350 [Pseudoalteromonas luteoviolacea]KKE83403.1 hypothetical protein N479_13615 [Pseudoalteromonas luteoviolacea S4054]KZN75840.1 hypothetical protein N481_05710 [Pseudoalteromonas luteoviolacea S4047-1]